MDIFYKFKQVYRDDAMSRLCVFKWAERFADGKMNKKPDIHLLCTWTKILKR
jgi:hypothetical protein